MTMAFHLSESKRQFSESLLSAKEYSKQFELNILNNTLRVQSLIDIFSSKPTHWIQDRLIVDEILKNSIFQNIAIYKKQKTLSKDGLPVLERINFEKLNKNVSIDLLPTTELSRHLRKKIQSMDKAGEPSAFTFSRNETGELAILIWKMSTSRNEYILLSAPLAPLFSDSVTAPKAQLVISDEQTNFKFLVAWNEDGKIQTAYDDEIYKKLDQPKSEELAVSQIKGEPALQFRWYIPSVQKVSTFVWIIFFTSVTITLLITLLMRFILSQNRQVASLVVKRTEDLENALNEATEANLAKTRFLGNMSHELRTPLNLILGMLELIEEKTQDIKMTEYLKAIRVSGDHLMRLISDLLDMAKQDSRDISIKSMPIRFPFFIEEVCRLISTDVQKKDLDFHVRIDENVPELIKGDPARLRQILMNLLRNSVKYTINGYIQLHVSCFKEINNSQVRKTTLRFEVKDTGVGIPKGKQTQIFDRFLQLDSSRVLSQGGVGLGLSIVKDLVQILKGNITVESEIGVGSTFTVDLDFELLSDLRWTSSFENKNSKELNIAVISFDKEFILDVKYALSAYVSKISFFYDDQVTLELDNDYTHFLIDHRCQKDLSRFTAANGKKVVILITETCPLLPTTLLNCLGIHRIENKLNLEPLVVVKNAQSPEHKIQKHLTLLIADDDAGNRQLFEAYLSDYSWTLIFSENGQDAFDKMQKYKPDIVVADLRMPIMDGLELTDRIRDYEKMNSTQKVPIILVTADAFEQTEEAARQHGVSHFLTKPVRKSKFIDAILSVT